MIADTRQRTVVLYSPPSRLAGYRSAWHGGNTPQRQHTTNGIKTRPLNVRMVADMRNGSRCCDEGAMLARVRRPLRIWLTMARCIVQPHQPASIMQPHQPVSHMEGKRMRLIASLAVLALASCSVPEDDAATLSAASLTPTCNDKAACDVMWQRAVAWVQDHGAYRFQLQTDTLIQTAGPADSSPDSAISVTRRPVSGDKAAIVFQSNCANMFGCIPSAAQLKAGFNRSVMNAETPPS